MPHYRASHGFAQACRDRNVGFSVGFPITEAVRHALRTLPEAMWAREVDSDDEIRDDAFVAELTGLVDLSASATSPRRPTNTARAPPDTNKPKQP